jgi:hypothetical protein
LTRRIGIKREVQFDDIGAILRKFVRSSIAAEDNVLLHRSLPIADQTVGSHVPGNISSNADMRSQID